VRIGVTVLAAVFSPLMGALLAGYFAYDADRDGRIRTRNLMIVLLGVSVVGLFAYAQIWGGLILGL
jgi:lipopolysaccharide export LptBFGC system permease protein LptF